MPVSRMRAILAPAKARRPRILTRNAATAELAAGPADSHHGAPRISVLDGVRGLAICLVLLMHFTPDYVMPFRAAEWAKKAALGGWTGVDLFFVLSGLLITEILLKSRGTPHAARNFYCRRALRILPLYLGSLVVVFGVLPWLIESSSFSTTQQYQGWYWLHCSNILVALRGFSVTTCDVVNLGPFWSLAVEEHFYLVWPLLVWTIPERRLLWVALGLIGISLLLRIGCVACQVGIHDGLYVSTPTRMDSLALGGLLTLLLRRYPPRSIHKSAWVVLAITASILLADFLLEKGLWTGSLFVNSFGFTVIGLFFASFIAILLTGSPQSWRNRAIDNRGWRFMGKYSYGIYVFHGLLMPVMHRWLPPEALLAALGSPLIAAPVSVLVKSAVSVGAALVSWHVLEAPCLRLKRRFESA